MKMIEWAKREIDLAIKKERGGKTSNEWDYGVACYESAYKAYQSLLNDNHSGFSIRLTQDILNKLIDGKPLTPITEEDFLDIDLQKGGSYQCSRMTSLFLEVDENGNKHYTDVNRVKFIDTESGIMWNSGLIRKWFDDNKPITLPYMPNKGYSLFGNDFLIDEKNGDFDSYYISYYTKPDGNRVDVKKFYTEYDTPDVNFHEITLEELKNIGFDIPKHIIDDIKGEKVND